MKVKFEKHHLMICYLFAFAGLPHRLSGANRRHGSDWLPKREHEYGGVSSGDAVVGGAPKANGGPRNDLTGEDHGTRESGNADRREGCALLNEDATANTTNNDTNATRSSHHDDHQKDTPPA